MSLVDRLAFPSDTVATDTRLPQGAKNYITPEGFKALSARATELVQTERPKLIKALETAASASADLADNADFELAKQNMSAFEAKLGRLLRSIDTAEIIDPRTLGHQSAVTFGATVTYEDSKMNVRTVTIVGVDEVDVSAGKISWQSPLGKALMRKTEGDVAEFKIPSGEESIEIIKISHL